MMKTCLILFLISFGLNFYGRENIDSIAKLLQISGEVSIHSNGLAPITAFSFGKPVIIALKPSLSMQNIPFSIFFQGSQPIISDITPFPKLQVNVGLSYHYQNNPK